MVLNCLSGGARLRCAFLRRTSLKPSTVSPDYTAFEAQTGFSAKLPCQWEATSWSWMEEGTEVPREAPRGQHLP